MIGDEKVPLHRILACPFLLQRLVYALLQSDVPFAAASESPDAIKVVDAVVVLARPDLLDLPAQLAYAHSIRRSLWLPVVSVGLAGRALQRQAFIAD